MLLQLTTAGFKVPDTPLEWMLTVVFILTALMGLAIIGLFVKYAGKNTIVFIKECLSDATGHGDLKYLIAFILVVLGILPIIWLGLFFQRWPSEPVLNTILLFLGPVLFGLLGLGTLDFWAAMKSGVAIMKPNPPKDILVDTTDETIIASPTNSDIVKPKKAPIPLVPTEADDTDVDPPVRDTKGKFVKRQ